MRNCVRLVLLILGLIGSMIFGFAFATSIFKPGYVEEIAKDMVRAQVERKTHEKIAAIDAKFLSGKAGVILKQHSEKIEQTKQQLMANIPERVATIIAEMRNLDCECRQKVGKSLRDGLELHLLGATAAQERLVGLIRTQYMETAEKLTREFRIFTGTNALVFMLLAAAAYFKRRAGMFLLAPALVLVVAAVFTGSLYLFNQNWLHTIIFSDYVGIGYVGYMAIAFVFLCDILFNRARVTAKLANLSLHAVGSAVQVMPC